jgi:hypothetical protein
VVGRVARMLLRAARLMINEGSGFECPAKCKQGQERTRNEERVVKLQVKQEGERSRRRSSRGEGARLGVVLDRHPQEVKVRGRSTRWILAGL